MRLGKVQASGYVEDTAVDEAGREPETPAPATLAPELVAGEREQVPVTG